jgi:lipopolysaccharide biosynthesis protein
MRAVILAHFDLHGRIDDYVVSALREYRKVADLLVLVSAGATSVPGDVRKLVDRFIARENVGYDFCSWREGIESIGSLAGLDELICVNDSVYGPTRPLGPVLADPRVANADMWGMCLSLQGTALRDHQAAPHVQSWFMAFRRPALDSTVFRSLWSGVVPLQRKEDLIDRYEIGLSEQFQDAGFRLAAIHDVRTVPRMDWSEARSMMSWSSPLRSLRMARRRMRQVTRQNPTEMQPLRLLRQGVPFLKSSVFRVNHYRLDLSLVSREFERISGYDMALVRRHQQRLCDAQGPCGISGRRRT